LILATVQVEADRLRSDRVESLLQSVREEATARLLARDGFESRETVVALAAEAVSQMKGETFAVQLSPADCVRFGEGLAEEIIRRVGRSQLSLTIAKEPALTGRGLVVRDLEGRQVWDNQFEQRLERLWPELRRQIAVQSGFVRASGSRGNGG
jgi:vacuolar-type H+-ATPase subunit E/Vma4